MDLKTFKAKIPIEWVLDARYLGKYNDFCGDWIYNIEEESHAVTV